MSYHRTGPTMVLTLDFTDNFTNSVDLSRSWNNESVALTSINSAAPVLVSQALWVDSSEESFYSYNGGKSYSLQVVDQPPLIGNQLWQFTPSGSSGSWKQAAAPSSSNFSELSRGINGIYTSGDGVGFALGGGENAATGAPVGGDFIQSPGMVMFNSTSLQWYNVSASGYSQGGIANNGAAQFVPSYGPAGLLLIFGGTVANSFLPGFDSVSIFDPSSQQWGSQRTSGTIPVPVINPCVVGVEGDDNTYEVGGSVHSIEK